MRKILSAILLIMLFFCGCQNRIIKPSSEVSLTDINYMVIVKLPSPSKLKMIDKKDDIEKVVSFINSIKKEKSTQDDANTWEFSIRTSGEKKHSINFEENIFDIDGVRYKISVNELKKLRELYNNLNYKEEPVIKYDIEKDIP